jgi:hypothetical protein
MTIVPSYALAPATGITPFEPLMMVTGQDDRGYRVADLDSGDFTTVLPFMRSGARIDTDLRGGLVAPHFGGYGTAQALLETQEEMAQVHLALCRAMEVCRDRPRAEYVAPSQPSYRPVNRPEARKRSEHSAFLGLTLLRCATRFNLRLFLRRPIFCPRSAHDGGDGILPRCSRVELWTRWAKGSDARPGVDGGRGSRLKAGRIRSLAEGLSCY